MSKPASVATTFKPRRLFTEYGRLADDVARSALTVDGKLTPADILRCIVEPSSYLTSVLKMLFVVRPDFDVIKMELLELIISEVEVFPFVLVTGHGQSWNR